MENNLLRSNKKGVSLMIGYVLLISIAVALSAAVFFYLKLYLPSEKPECYQDINLVLDSASCEIVSDKSIVRVNITNKGFFNVSGVYIKIGNSDRIFRTIINDPEDGFINSECSITSASLAPGEKFCKSLSYESISTGLGELSIEPFVFIGNEVALCTEALITRPIACS
ncbi:hypothetical protein J4416_03610 [Candidatus Pacearchaeota archaeon]|nr:hypothetical protein [Candidatus Pacearchaeota archaeon]